MCQLCTNKMVKKKLICKISRMNRSNWARNPIWHVTVQAFQHRASHCQQIKNHYIKIEGSVECQGDSYEIMIISQQVSARTADALC